MRTIAIDLDDASLERAEAYAATKRTSIDALVNEYLRSVAGDFVSAALPQGASQQFMKMLRHGGRDTTATFLAKGRWDEFEQPMPAYFFAWARLRPGVIIDGGANTGFYSVLAANAAAANRVLAFEPDPVVRALLQMNVDANGLGGRIEPQAAALSDRNGRAMLHIPAQDHGVIETSSSLESKFKSWFSDVLEVETITIDQAAAVLAGAEQTVAKHRPIVFAEVLDRADFGVLSQFIARHNYMDVPLRSRGVLTAQGTVAFAVDAWNHALVPAEVLSRFLVASRAAV